MEQRMKFLLRRIFLFHIHDQCHDSTQSINFITNIQTKRSHRGPQNGAIIPYTSVLDGIFSVYAHGRDQRTHRRTRVEKQTHRFVGASHHITVVHTKQTNTHILISHLSSKRSKL
jgi:hypothetical protein